MPSLVILVSVMKVCTSWFDLWSHVLKMKELEVHFWHVILWQFKNNKNIIETAKKICVYDQGVIIEHQVQNRFSKFHSDNTSLKNELWPGRSSDLDQYALRKLVECNLHRSTWEFVLDTSQSTIYYHLLTFPKMPPTHQYQKHCFGKNHAGKTLDLS